MVKIKKNYFSEEKDFHMISSCRFFFSCSDNVTSQIGIRLDTLVFKSDNLIHQLLYIPKFAHSNTKFKIVLVNTNNTEYRMNFIQLTES